MSGLSNHLKEFAGAGWIQKGHGYNEWGHLIKNGGFERGGSTIHITTQMHYEAYAKGKGSRRFLSVPEAQRFCGG